MFSKVQANKVCIGGRQFADAAELNRMNARPADDMYFKRFFMDRSDVFGAVVRGVLVFRVPDGHLYYANCSTAQSF